MSMAGPEGSFDFAAFEQMVADIPSGVEILREEGRDYGAHSRAMLDTIREEPEPFNLFAELVKDAGWQEIRLRRRSYDP